MRTTGIAFHNTQVMTTNVGAKKPNSMLFPGTSEGVRRAPSEQNEFSDNSDKEEDFKELPKTSVPPNEEDGNINIFERQEKANVVEPSHNLPQHDEEQMKKHKRKRKVKKAKKDDTETFIHENQNLADAISVVVVPPNQEKEVKMEKEKPFEFDKDSDYEGGEDDETGNDDKIKPYDIDDDNDYMFDDALKPRKRKKKLMNKKKKKMNPDDTLNSSMAPVLGDTNIGIEDLKASKNELSINLGTRKDMDSNPNRNNSQNRMNDTHDNDSVNIENEYIDEDKGPKREYSTKYALRVILYGYRVTNFFVSYDNRFNRLWRLFIFYIEAFFMLWICGIIFYKSGNTEEVGGMTGYHCFGIAFLTCALDRVLHFIILLIIVNLRKRPEDEEIEAEDQDLNLRASTANIQNSPQSPDKQEERKAEAIENSTDNGQSEDKKVGFREKLKNMDKDQASLLLFIGIAACILTFLWIFIIVMSVRFTIRGGKLWGYLFAYTLFFTFLFAEPFNLFCVSIFIYKKKWNKEELL